VSDRDRYHEPYDETGTAWLAEQLRALQQRVADLEGQPMVGSQMVVQDPNGVARIRLGLLADGVAYGFEIYNKNGTLIQRVSEDGQTLPRYIVPMNVMPAFLSGGGPGFRPGTNQSTFGGLARLWQGQFHSIGDKVDWSLQAYANGGTIEWRVLVNEVGQAPVVVVGPNSDSVNTDHSGTFTIPEAALASGTDPAGRLMELTYEARIAGGSPTTVDLLLLDAPVNHT